MKIKQKGNKWNKDGHKTSRQLETYHWYDWYTDSWRTCEWFLIAGYDRAVKTKQERTENDFIRFDEDAKEYGIRVRGKRTKRNIPHSYDDPRNGIWDGRKSWKHVTKRRKQWKLKG